MQPWPKALAVI